MSRLLLLAALIAALSLSVQALANEGVGFVDMQRVLEESKLGQRLQKQLRDEFEPRTKGFVDEEREIAQMQQDLAKDRPLMSNEQIAKKEQEIKTRIETYQKKTLPIQQELMKAQQEKGREILEPAREALNAVAKKKKLGMVFERNVGGLLYADEGLDITAEVIQQMDAKTK
ncbi:OmpH family outer membrane protein [Thermochromatium tepidum]|uniref:OmpH family outer membrane protein n=1 Tax=Thermochromatium tepidum ATCC 43061 TaxID=316276 RepID=A0A6I6EFU5_THETI|nr:OmpH family outer membrane protein [Thermochromatium tepidum]QGU33080.1 OmpH family outer membrane protein [Thermochromatium tepidum ATCC 43061]